MAKGNFDAEIKSSMQQKPEPGDTASEIAQDKARGIRQGSAQDREMDARRSPGVNGGPPVPEHGPPAAAPHTHPVNVAAGIAHAILGHQGMGVNPHQQMTQ